MSNFVERRRRHVKHGHVNHQNVNRHYVNHQNVNHYCIGKFDFPRITTAMTSSAMNSWHMLRPYYMLTYNIYLSCFILFILLPTLYSPTCKCYGVTLVWHTNTSIDCEHSFRIVRRHCYFFICFPDAWLDLFFP